MNREEFLEPDGQRIWKEGFKIGDKKLQGGAHGWNLK